MRDLRGAAWRARGPAGAVLGLALVGGWLALWRWASDAADLFAPATALAGLVALALARACRSGDGWAIARGGLRVAGGAALGLAVAASLSLGAFLPAGLAAWASPVLGRFGGAAALALLAVGLALAAATGLARPRGLLLDAIVTSALAAVWIATQVPRQASFPPPPATGALLAPRFDLLLALGGALALLAALGASDERRATSDERGRRGPHVLTPVARRVRHSRLPTPDSRLPRSVRRLPSAVCRLCYRWAGLVSVVGLAGGLLAGWGGWYGFALLGAALLAGGLAARPRDGGWRWRAALDRWMLLRAGGWLALGLAVIALTYFTTAEDLQTVLLRNTVERRVMQFWRATTGDVRFAARPAGALAGTVRDAAGRPLAGAAVVVATVGGQTYGATSDAAGRYTIAGVPRGNYLPLAVAPGYRQGPALAPGGRVATVRPGRTSGGVDFALRPAPPLVPAGGVHDLRLGAPTTASVANPEPSAAIRRTFSFVNLGLTLDDGLVHEPPASLGPGPFPILLIIYPGEPKDWEGVSIPLAAKGYVVVSYFPERLLDLAGDLDDLGVLFGLVADGRLSARGDPTRLVLVGGSVSTVYTYLLARELARSPARWRLRALVQYGGIFDFFRYRYSWERGQVYIDPGISGLEYLLIALGRPDTRPEIYLRLSPRYDLGPGDLPPTLLIHAGRDVIVPVEQSELADATLTRLGIAHRLLIYPTLEHYLDTSTRNPADIDMLDQTLAFLHTYTGP